MMFIPSSFRLPPPLADQAINSGLAYHISPLARPGENIICCKFRMTDLYGELKPSSAVGGGVQGGREGGGKQAVEWWFLERWLEVLPADFFFPSVFRT